MNEPSNLKPPPEFDSWLAYAVDEMDTRSLFLDACFDCTHWGRLPQRDEMLAAAQAELERMQDLEAATVNWDETNNERIHLIEREIAEEITEKETERLARLQRVADLRMDIIAPEGLTLLRESGIEDKPKEQS